MVLLSLFKKSLSYLVVLSLVGSLVPSTALAEAVEGQSEDMQQAVPVELPVGEDASLDEDEISSDDQASGEEPALPDGETVPDQEGVTPAPEDEGDEGRATLPVEEGEPVAESQATEGDAASDEEPLGEDTEDVSDKEEQDAEEGKEQLEAEAEKKGTPTLSAVAHVQNIGWQQPKGFGDLIGTSGRSLRVEALQLSLKGDDIPSGSLEYQTHVQNIGWQGWVRDGQTAGTSGRSLRIEALRIRLTGDLAKEYDVYYQVHAQNVGWMGLAKNGEASGTSGRSYRLEGVRIWLVKKGSAAPKATFNNAKSFLGVIGLQAQAHVQNVGWMTPVGSGSIVGTTGRSLRLEALNMSVSGLDVSGGITYRSHVQNVGWQGWVSNGATSGTVGRGLRVEAIEAKLTGELASEYDLYYRAHVSNVGWLAWAKNGASAGSSGLSLRVEALQVQLVPKGGAAPSSSDAAYGSPFIEKASVTYAAWVQGSGWQSSVSNGGTAGTTGKSRRVESLKLNVSGSGNGITYRAHIQNVGWDKWVSNGSPMGSGGSGRRIEAIQVKLTGIAANLYNVYYRTHVSGYGWLGWTSNGASSGSVGMSKAVEAVQVMLVPKSGGAPGSTSTPFIDVDAVGKRVVSVARSQLGAAYTEANDYYAEGGPFNCSGFTYFCYLKAGYVIPRKQGYYSYYWNENNKEYSQMWWVEKRGNWTTDVSRLKPGDLVFFSPINDKYHTGHVGVYIGGGQMIDAFPGYGVSVRGVLQSGFVGGGNPLF